MHGNKRSLFKIDEVSILEIYDLKFTEVGNQVHESEQPKWQSLYHTN